MTWKELATESSSSPASVQLIPTGSEKGCGRRSLTMPTTGCSIEAVNWKASVINPTWEKSRR